MGYLLPVLSVVAFLTLLYIGRGYWAWLSVAAFLLAEWAIAGVQSRRPFPVTAGITVAVALLWGRKGEKARLVHA